MRAPGPSRLWPQARFERGLPRMPRVIGVDPGTVSIDFCGLDDGALFFDRSLPTAEALADPAVIVDLLEEAHRTRALDLVAGPSGYGLPLRSEEHTSELQSLRHLVCRLL